MASKKRMRQKIKAIMRANARPRDNNHVCAPAVQDHYRRCSVCGETWESISDS